MVKRYFAIIIGLLLFMANNAFSAEDHENRQNPGQVRLFQVDQNNARRNVGIPLTNDRYTPVQIGVTACLCLTAICGMLFIQNYLVEYGEKARCRPYLDSQVFTKYNSDYKTNLLPTGVLEQWGANILNNPILLVLDKAYKSNREFMFNLTNTALNRSHLECQYSPSVNYQHSDQSCLEFYSDYQGNPFDLTYNVSAFFDHWKNYGFYRRLYVGSSLSFILMFLIYCFA